MTPVESTGTNQRVIVPEIAFRPQGGLRGVAIIASALVALLADGTSTAIVNTGLPYLQGITAATPDEASWIITTFNATYYAFVLLSPWLLARFGLKRQLVVALAGFGVLSVALACTTNLPLFLVLRAVQGACLGSVFVPAVVLFFSALSPATMTLGTPVFIFFALSGSVIGTVIGAYAADAFGGNMVFLPGAILTLFTAALVMISASSQKGKPSLPFDALGLALSIMTFGALQFLVNDGERRNWFDDPSVVAGTIVLAIAAPSFAFYELFGTRCPHVDFRMFATYANLRIGALINMTIGAAGYSVTMLVAYLQAAVDATAVYAGELVLVRLATYVIGVSGAFLLVRYRPSSLRTVVIVGTLGSAVGLFGFSQQMTTTADGAAFLGLSLLFGFFYSLLSEPVGSLVIRSMPITLLAAGLAVYKLTSPIGLMLATAGAQTMLDHRTALVRSELAAQITLARAPILNFVSSHGTQQLTALVLVQAQTLSYGFVMAILAFVMVPIVALAFFVRTQSTNSAGGSS